jgi:hypothetical protein
VFVFFVPGVWLSSHELCSIRSGPCTFLLSLRVVTLRGRSQAEEGEPGNSLVLPPWPLRVANGNVSERANEILAYKTKKSKKKQKSGLIG